MWPDKIDADFIKSMINAFPYDLPALYELVSVMDVAYDESIDSAQITLIGTPRIRISKDFLEKYCETWSDVAVLIHHELSHKMLMHVWNELDNLAIPLTDDQKNLLYDIRIQGLSYQLMPQPAYRQLTRRCYENKPFPFNLLYSGSKHSTYLHTALQREIYSPYGVSLEKAAEVIFGCDDGDGGGGGKDDGHSDQNDQDNRGAPMLGDHNDMGKQSQNGNLPEAQTMNHAKEAIDRIHDNIGKMEKSSRKKARIGRALAEAKGNGNSADNQVVGDTGGTVSCGHSESLFVKDIEQVVDRYNADRKMREMMMRASVDTPLLKAKRAIKNLFACIVDMSVMPNFRDRRAIALYSRGIWPVYFKTLIEESHGLCHVYIDASGSQFHVMAFVIKLISELKDYLCPTVHFFSDSIVDVHKSKLRPGMSVQTTGGTDFNAVVDHAIKNKINKCLVITDGISSVSDANVEIVKKIGQKYIIGFTEEYRGGGFDEIAWKKFNIPRKEGATV